MSIFHISDIADKPSSYTRDIVNKEINYQSLKNEVRTSIIDKYSSFEKLTKQPQSPNRKTGRDSPKRHQNTLRTLDVLFGKPYHKEEAISQSSPAKITGLKKKMQQIGGQESAGKFLISGQNVDFKNSYYESSASKHSFLSPQSRLNTQENKGVRSGSLTNKFQPERGHSISNTIPIQRLVEIQNLLEMTPQSELQALPRNYLDELARVASSITRNLRHHNDIRLKV